MLIILQYHEVSKKLVFNPNFLPLGLFKRQVKFLNTIGAKDYTSLFLSYFPSSVTSLDMLITFDDGYKGVLENAFPVMERYNFKGVVFVVTGFLGRHSTWDVPLLTPLRHLSAEDLRFLHSKGWLIGSHSHFHRDLTTLPYSEIVEELKMSKEILQDIIGQDVIFFSYPFGRVNQKVKEALKEVGFKFAFKSSSTKFCYDDFWEIPRNSVYLTDYNLSFKLDPSYSKLEHLKESIFNKFAILSPLFLKILNSLNRKPSNNQ